MAMKKEKVISNTHHQEVTINKFKWSVEVGSLKASNIN